MRKITLFFAVLFATMTAFASTLYLAPNANWKTDNARYAAYFFGNGETWLSMTDSNSDGVYEVEAPAGYPNVIFCRMDPSATANNWNNKWNQTADLTVPTDNKVKFVVPEGVWDGAGSTCWVEFDNNGPVVLPETWTVAGSSDALFGTAWAPSNEANDLVKGTDGVWTKFYDDVTLSAGDIEYKIVKSHVWGEAYPAENAKLTIPANGKYDVTFTFNATTHAVNATAAAVVEPTSAITAVWSINGTTLEDGATIEKFPGLTVTFSGVDHLGRKVDGTEITKVYPLISTTETFFVVAEDGTTTPVVSEEMAGYNGVLKSSATGCVVTLSLADRYTVDESGAYIKPGNYRVVLPGAKVQLQPKVDNQNVFAQQDFTFNFKIENDLYKEEVVVEPVDAAFTANPADKDTVADLKKVEITFTDATALALADLGQVPNPAVWPFCNQVAEYEGFGTQTMPVAPMTCAVEGNKLTLSVYAGYEDKVTTAGDFTVTIPAGVVLFDATHTNKAITLSYTVTPVTNDTVVVTSVEELKANEGKTVLFKGIETVSIKQGWRSFTYLTDSLTEVATELYPVPSKFDAYGVLAEGVFTVDSVVAIYGFNTIDDLVMFLEEATEEQKAASYEIKQPVIVTLSSMFSFYVQYEGQSMFGGASWNGIMVQAGRMSTYMAKVGDAIQIKGSYSAAVYDEDYNLTQPAYFALENATLVSENNKLNYASIDPSYIEEYYATLGRLPKGGQIAEDDMGYYYVYSYSDWVVNPETNMYDEVIVKDSLQLMIAGPVDLSAYVGVELDLLVAGVADFDPSTGAPIFYVTELQESKLYYNNIAELIAAGSQTEYTMSSVLRNPVLLTYISYNQWAGYTLFVQDETGALAIKGLGIENENGDGYDFPYDIKPGDMITGVEGFTSLGEGAPYMWSGAEYYVEPKLEKVADGVITPLNITMAQFTDDIEALIDALMMGDSYSSPYANKVICLKDLTKYVDPEDEKWPWLRNGNDSIQVSTYYWGDIAVPAYIASLTGVVDYGIINSNGTPTIQPLNADAVIEQLVEAKNAYAYDVRVEQTEETVTVSYALNAPANAVRVLAKVGDKVVATKAGSPVAQIKEGAVANTHSVEFAIAELPAKEITFEVEVTGDIVTVPTQVAKNYQFYHPKGVEVDANPESEFFGRIYATEGMPVAKNGDVYISDTNGNGVGQGLYAFDAALNPIANKDGKYGFTGGLTFNNLNPAGKSDYSPLRVVLSEDGRLFFSRQSVGVSPLVEVNPADLDANFTEVFTGFVCDSTTYDLNTADGAFMAAPNVGFDVKGTGENLQVLMLSTKVGGWGAAKSAFRVDEYNLGTATTWSAAPSTAVEALSGKYIVTYTSSNVEYDNEGGMWLIQHRGTPTASEPALVHLNAAGEVDYTNTSINAAASGFAFNADYTLLAFAGNGNKKCTIYAVGKDENGAPTLTEKYTFETTIGTNLNDIAWDYADNLYIVGNSGEYLKVFALPRENAVVTTPAAARYTVDLSLPDTVRFANIAAIYEKGIWEESRYADYTSYSTIAILESQPTVVDVVKTSGRMGGGITNYYLNDGTGVIVMRAEGDRYEPVVDDDWNVIGYDTIYGLNIEVGKKLPAEFYATIDFHAVIDDETYLPTGDVYGAPIMEFMPKVVGTEVDEWGWESKITEPYDTFVARCEASDFVETVVEADLLDVLANRIKYAGQLLKVDATANYYAATELNHMTGGETTTAYLYCGDAESAFDVESYEDGDVTYVYVSPKMTEDYYNYAGQVFNVLGENLPAAALDANYKISVSTIRFDWNSVTMGQSIILKEGWEVKEDTGVDVENNELVVNIYSNNGAVYVETEAGAMIEVYTINGLRVFAGVSNTNTTIINGLNTNVAIIRVNGEAYKVMVK